MSTTTKTALGLLLLLAAPTVFAMGFLDSLLLQASNSSAQWMQRAIQIATLVFGMLVLIEFTWFAMQMTLKKAELSEIITSLMFKVVAIGFFFTLLLNAPTWIPLISQSFMQAGATISGTTVEQFSPSAIISRGLDAAALLVAAQQADAPGTWELLTSPGQAGAALLTSIIIGLAALMLVIAFAILALQFLVALLEAYIVLGAGALLLGFSGSRWTMSFSEKYLGYSVSVGAKLLVVMVLVGFGTTFAEGVIAHWNTLRAGTGAGGIKIVDYLAVLAGSVLFGAMSFMLPSLAGSLLNGAASMSLGNTAGAASSAVMPVAGLASAGAGAALGVAAGAAGKIATALAPSGAISGIASKVPSGGGGGGSLAGPSAFGGPGAPGAGAPGAGAGFGPSAGPGASAGPTGGGAGFGAGPSAGSAPGPSAGFAGAGPAAGAGADTGAGPGAGAGPAAAPGAGPTAGAGFGAGGAGAPSAGAGPTGGGAGFGAGPSAGSAPGPGAGFGPGTGAGFADPRSLNAAPGGAPGGAPGEIGAGWQDYRDTERAQKQQDRARASASPTSRKMLKASDKMESIARGLSAFGSRRRPLSSDGHTGSAPSIRMRLDD